MEYLKKNFTTIIIVAVIVIAALVILSKKLKKRKLAAEAERIKRENEQELSDKLERERAEIAEKMKEINDGEGEKQK